MTTNTEAFETWYQKDLLDAPVHQQQKDRMRRAFDAGAALASAPAQPVAMTDERAAFEAWYATDANAHTNFKFTPEQIAELRDGDGYGAHRHALNGKWEGWQARAALSAQPEAKAQAVPEGWRESLETIATWARGIKNTLDSPDYIAANVPGLKDAPLYRACERALFIQNRIRDMLAAAPQPPAPSEQPGGYPVVDKDPQPKYTPFASEKRNSDYYATYDDSDGVFAHKGFYINEDDLIKNGKIIPLYKE